MLSECPLAFVVRLGWQIGDAATGITMLAALDRWQAEQAEVAVSRAWRPACSHLHDTAAALLYRLTHPGAPRLDANADEAWTKAGIGAALQRQHGRMHGRLRVHVGHRHDPGLTGGPARPGSHIRVQRSRFAPSGPARALRQPRAGVRWCRGEGRPRRARAPA